MDTAPYRARLEQELATLAEESAAAKQDRAPVELDQQSVGRLSRMDALQVQAMAQETERRRQARMGGSQPGGADGQHRKHDKEQVTDPNDLDDGVLGDEVF